MNMLKLADMIQSNLKMYNLIQQLVGKYELLKINVINCFELTTR